MSEPGLEPGTVFAEDFRIVRPLNEGGMGAVYVAVQLSTGSERALKLMHVELAQNEDLRRRFAQEARIGSKIRSEHVVQVLGAGVDDATGMPWLCMELLQGSDLARWVESKGPLEPRQLLPIYEQMCHALGDAHAQGIVHRDLKPENLFLTKSRRADGEATVKILDFGISKVVSEVTEVTQAIGTPAFMAPEQTSGRGVSPRTDVWALGLIAFYLLTGRHYWKTVDQGPVTLLREMTIDPLEPASVRAKSFGAAHRLPPGFNQWFARCVARDRQERYADATEAFSALQKLAPAPGVNSLGATDPAPGPVGVDVYGATALPEGSVAATSPMDEPKGDKAPPVAPTEPDVAPISPVRTEKPYQPRAAPRPAPARTPRAAPLANEARRPSPARPPGTRGGNRLLVGLAIGVGVGLVAVVALVWDDIVAVVAPPRPLPSASRSTKASPGSRPPSAKKEDVGYLTLVCEPSCSSVVIDGRKVGPSPVVKRAVRAGSHRAKLRSGKVKKSISFTIKAGKTTHRRVSMGGSVSPKSVSPKSAADDCTPPYLVDSKGNKSLKPGCR